MLGRILLASIAILVVGGVAYTALNAQKGDAVKVKMLTEKAVKGGFEVTVMEDGNLESAANVDVKCRVAGGSSILWIVEDGKVVEKDEEIIKLDSSALEDQIVQQKNTLEKARAVRIQAEKDHQVAKISVNEYLEGIFKKDSQDAETTITIALENLRSAENSLAHAKKMFRKGYISKLELEGEEFNVKRANLELDAANTSKDVLVKFTKEKTLEDLQSKVETTEAKMKSERASFTLEENKLKRLEAQLVNCVIKAPQSGMVVYANEQRSRFGGSQGPQIEEGASVREQQNLVKLPDLSQMQVKVNVHESKVDKLRTGQPAYIKVQGKSYNGTVAYVANQPEATSFFSAGTKEYGAIVKIQGRQEDLRPGMTAEVQILITKIEDKILIPVASVLEIGSKNYCWVVEGESDPVEREIKIGWTNDQVVEVVSGIEVDEEVVKNPRRFAKKLIEIEAKLAAEQDGKKSKFGDTSKMPKVEKGSGKGAPSSSGKGGPSSGKGGPSSGTGGRPSGTGGGGKSKKGRMDLMSYDKNKDGKVSKEEAPASMAGFFDRLDTDKDGFITKKEIDALMSRFKSGGGGGGRPKN